MNQSNPIFHSLRTIEERLQEKLTVESLAESIHFSKYHYQRLFREAVGESVMRYVARRRLFLAAGDLAGTDSSVLEIALRYGYDSHEGFTRSFKAHMGVTPTEYRRYHTSIASPKMQKEKSAMLYSKTTDDIIRELNSLIVQAKETAAFTREKGGTDTASSAFYTPFWEFIAGRADSMADELTAALNRIAAIPQQPDEISVRFLMIKSIEDAVFQSHVTAFQARLTLCRARPEHRAAYESICEKYEALAQAAQIKSGKIAAFFHELASLIFQDMRENAQALLDRAAEQGRAAYEPLLSGSLPYTYIGEEVRHIAGELSAVPLEAVTVSLLEDFIFRLDMVASAAEMDALRSPSHRPLFKGISEFRKRLQESEDFFQGLSKDAVQTPDSGQSGRSLAKKYQDMAFQGNILLFYLKGELQKLAPHLAPEQKTALAAVCETVNTAIEAAQRAQGEEDEQKIVEFLQTAYRDLTAETDKLGAYGDALKFIGENLLMGFKPE